MVCGNMLEHELAAFNGCCSCVGKFEDEIIFLKSEKRLACIHFRSARFHAISQNQNQIIGSVKRVKLQLRQLQREDDFQCKEILELNNSMQNELLWKSRVCFAAKLDCVVKLAPVSISAKEN